MTAKRTKGSRSILYAKLNCVIIASIASLTKRQTMEQLHINSTNCTMTGKTPPYLQAHCQSRTSPSTNQSFVKELAKPTQEMRSIHEPLLNK
jgi:hypothetical protein